MHNKTINTRLDREIVPFKGSSSVNGCTFGGKEKSWILINDNVEGSQYSVWYAPGDIDLCNPKLEWINAVKVNDSST